MRGASRMEYGVGVLEDLVISIFVYVCCEETGCHELISVSTLAPASADSYSVTAGSKCYVSTEYVVDGRCKWCAEVFA